MVGPSVQCGARRWVAILLTLAVGASASASSAQEPPAMASGTYWGSGAAEVRGEGPGFSTEAEFQLLMEVAVSGQEVTGTGDARASSVFDASRGGFDGSGQTASLGAAEIVGTPSRLQLTVGEVSSGTVTAGDRTSPIEGAGTVGTFELPVLGAGCDEVWGEWFFPPEAASGFSIDVSGSWTLYLDTTELRAEIEHWVADVNAAPSPDAIAALPPGAPPVLAVVAEITVRHRTFMERLAGDPQVALTETELSTISQLMHDTASLYARLGNLSECDEQLIGAAQVQRFRIGTTEYLQDQITELGLSETVIPASTLYPIVGWLEVAGAIGSGAMDPVAARAAEDAVALIIGRGLNAHEVQPAESRNCTCIEVTDEIRRLAALAAQHGLEAAYVNEQGTGDRVAGGDLAGMVGFLTLTGPVTDTDGVSRDATYISLGSG